MSDFITLRGMTNVSFWADDIKAARDWYSKILGQDAYFQRPNAENPAYIEFRLGDAQDELGIIDANYAPRTGTIGAPGGAILYWHVDDVIAAFERLKAAGATEYEPPTKRGENGWLTASVIDPFGNVLGLMYSPHYVEVTGDQAAA